MLGEDHPDTLASANGLAADLRDLGEYQAARDLDEDTLARRRRVLGEDHPDTLGSANNLAIDLRDAWPVPGGPRPGRGHPDPPPPGARRGPPRHPASANNLATTCASLASTRRPATWTRTPWPAAAGCSARTTPTPWRSANDLAADLRELGEYQQARDLDEDTLTRRRRVLGEDHPDTLASVDGLAATGAPWVRRAIVPLSQGCRDSFRAGFTERTRAIKAERGHRSRARGAQAPP